MLGVSELVFDSGSHARRSNDTIGIVITVCHFVNSTNVLYTLANNEVKRLAARFVRIVMPQPPAASVAIDPESAFVRIALRFEDSGVARSFTASARL